MSLELLGSRILAPYFGNSIYVWGSLITVFLAALAAGYYLGGLLADHFPHSSTLAWPLFLASPTTFFIPALANLLGPFLLSLKLEPRWGSFLMALALFFIPSLWLGMLSPLAIRLLTLGLDTLGASAGTLYAVSTLGSIFGTFVTAFYLIPVWGVADLTRGAGLFLAGLSGLAWIILRRWRLLPLTLATVFLFALTWQPWVGSQPARSAQPAGQLPPGWKVLYQADSLYHHLWVVENADSRFLRFDNSWQSGMYLADPYATRFEYTDFFHLALVMNPKVKDVLFIGLGGGSAPKKFLRDYPEARIDVVELDPAVIAVARRFFFVPPDSPRFRVLAQDGRVFLQQTTRKYDLIVVDAYYADSIPFHLTTQEFLRELKSRLQPGGLVAANLIGAFEGPKSEVFRSLYRTFSSVFPTRYLFPVHWDKEADPSLLRNIILIAGEGRPLDRKILLQRAQEMVTNGQIQVPRLATYAASLYQNPVAVGDVPLLTDDHAPIDNLLRFDPQGAR